MCFYQYLLIMNLTRTLISVLMYFCYRWYWQQGEVAHLMAAAVTAVLYNPQLCQGSLGEILHGFLHPVHHLDRRLLLLHGLDGECNK